MLRSWRTRDLFTTFDLIFQIVNRKSSWESSTGVQSMDRRRRTHNLAHIHSFSHSVMLSREDASYLAFMGVCFSFSLSLIRLLFLCQVFYATINIVIDHTRTQAPFLQLDHFLFCTINSDSVSFYLSFFGQPIDNCSISI